MSKIIVQLENGAWTTRAMHLACSIAHQTGSEIVLLQLVEVTNIGTLGAGFDDIPGSAESYSLARECEQIAAQYHVPVALERMEYATRFDALAQAAEALEASALFAPMAQSRFSAVNRLNLWNLTRKLHDCCLYTLAGSDTPDEIVPAVSMGMPRRART